MSEPMILSVMKSPVKFLGKHFMSDQQIQGYSR